MSVAVDRRILRRGLPGWLALILLLALCYAIAALGGLATFPEIGGWYRILQKPSWTPPNWLFGPAWTTLYGMMAVAAWLVWRNGAGLRVPMALPLFFVQLAFNLAWSFLFFMFHRPDLALVDIVLLWVTIGATVAAFVRSSRAAALLMLPYWAWVTFATSLNAAIWRLNA